MGMRDLIIKTLSHGPEEDWRGLLAGEAWWEDVLDGAIASEPEGYFERKHRNAGPLTEADHEYESVLSEYSRALEAMVGEGTVGRSWSYETDWDPALGGDGGCMSRHYFVWLKTSENRDFTERCEARDRRVVEFFMSLPGSRYGTAFTFGRDAEVIARMP